LIPNPNVASQRIARPAGRLAIPMGRDSKAHEPVSACINAKTPKSASTAMWLAAR
jgi:hypothetical protein